MTKRPIIPLESTLLKKLPIALGALVVLLVLAVIFGPMLIPADAYIGRIVTAVKQATGRDLAISGPVSVRLVPNIALQAEGVSLSGAVGGSEKSLVSIGKLAVGLKLMPLLSHRVEISRLDLSDPVIHLEVDKSGKGNWAFTPATPAAKPEAAPKETPAQGGDVGAQLRQLSLGTIHITNGTISYLDDRTAKHETASKLDTSLTLDSIDQPLSLKGSVEWNAQTVSFDADVKKPSALIGGGTTPVSLSIESKLMKLALEGNGEAQGPLRKFEGRLDLTGSSLRALMTWAGSPPKLSGSALGNFAIHTQITTGASLLALSKLSLALDAIKAGGDVSVATSGARPMIKGDLSLGALDLNPYLATAPAGAAAPAQPAPIAAPEAAGGGWSEVPIDLSALRTVDTNLTLSMDSLRYQQIAIGRSVIGIVLSAGRLRTDFKQLTLYGGSATGHLGLDGSTGGVGLDTQMTLSNIQIQPALELRSVVSRISGAGSVSLTLTGRGRSQADLMRGLGGMGSLHVANGAVKGFDLAAIVHNPASALAQDRNTAQTDFTALAATFTITSGVASNSDLTMETGVGGVTGSGTVDLYHRTLDYRIEPHVASSLQGGKTGIAGTTVPILISGPWASPSYKPDLSSVVQQKLQKALGGRVDKLLGGASGSGSGTGNQAGNLLKGLLGH